MPTVTPEPSTPTPEPIQGDVTVKVVIGTIHWEKGTFEKGDTFTCTREELAKFGLDVEIVSS